MKQAVLATVMAAALGVGVVAQGAATKALPLDNLGLESLDIIVPDPAASGAILFSDLQVRATGQPRGHAGATVQTKRSSESDDLFLQVSLVAGARSRLYRPRCTSLRHDLRSAVVFSGTALQFRE